MANDIPARAYNLARAALVLASLALVGLVWCATGGHVSAAPLLP